MIFDLVHIDGESERICFRAADANGAGWTMFFKLGSLSEYITGIRMTGEYPANRPITKSEFRERCGTGRLPNELGHYYGGTADEPAL